MNILHSVLKCPNLIFLLYSLQIDNPDFHVDKSVPAAPGSTGGTEVALDVVFEPSRLGEQRGMLTVSSQIGGEYTFPLFGTCIPPKPQGPFTVKAGSSTAIVFHNVFPNTTPFTFQVGPQFQHFVKYDLCNHHGSNFSTVEFFAIKCFIPYKLHQPFF